MNYQFTDHTNPLRNEKHMKNVRQHRLSSIIELVNCTRITTVPDKHILYVPDIKERIDLLRAAGNIRRMVIATDHKSLNEKKSFYKSVFSRINTDEKKFLGGNETVSIFEYTALRSLENKPVFSSQLKDKKFINLILCDVTELHEFQRFVRRARWIENFKVVGIVENPACMVGLLGASFQLCALSRSLKYFYRDMFKRAEIVFHNSNDSLECKRGGSAEDLALFFEKTFPHLLPVLHSLISEGAFSVESFVAVHRDELGDYIPFFGQYKIKSSKLEILADLVNFVEGERIIVVKNPELVPYVQKEIGNSAKVISPMEIGEITDQKIINFGLVNLHTHEKSYIFMSENEEKIYDAIMNAENQFETQPRQTIEMIEDNFDDTISGSQIKLIEPGNKGIARKIYYVCKFRLDICNILKDKGFEIVRNLNRMFIHPARQPNSITDFGFNLASLINFPISPRGYPRIKTSHVLFIKYVTFGHVINHNFFNQKKFYGKGVLYLTPNSITLFFFTREINLKMEIENSLEKYLFLDQKDNFLNIYFLMKSYPKIFVLKSIDIGRLEELIGKYRQGHHIFDVLEWKRATFADIDFMNNRYDVRVNVDLKLACNQEIPTKELEKYFFNPKDIILNLLTMYSAGVYLYPITEHYNKSLGVDDIMKKITNFDVRYMFMCLFSHKGRYISHKFSEAHIDLILKKANIKKFCDFIEIVVEDRNFEPERIITDFFEKETNTYVSEELKNAVYLRSAYITPLSIIYNYPKISPTNRVLRNFDPDKFIRISFREDNTLDRVYNSQDEVYDYFRSVLNDGFFICDRKYFFLASSASQLRLHAAWFVTPHVKNKELVGPDYIRSWLGNFDDIHNIGKYTIRLGQALSATIMDIEIDEFVEEKDAISSTGYCFTDGVGKISEKLAKRLSEKLELPQVPSAFQIRFAGYKGVVSIDPRIKDSEPGLVMRESMKKFHSSHNKLEVVSWSQEIPAHLNRQIILILESLGITESTFTDLHEECIFHHFFTTPRSTDFLDNHCAFFKPTPKFMHHTFFQKLLIAAYNKQLSDLHKKEKIFLRKGRILMGVIDEFDVLEKEEVFVMTRIDGIYAPITGQVLVAKNPCLHPGDIRLVTAVDRKELYHMRDVLIFSKRGKRPIFNMCSGSDLDGDLYFCSWEPRLIPPKTYTADNYISSCHLYKTVVSMTDIVNFFIKFMRDNELGSIANAHLAFSDQKIRGVTAPESLKLATLFNMGVDFPKTGFVARLPLDLTPTIYPDFMNIKGQPSYKSTKTLGVLYRRSKMLKFNILSLCDCINCISKCFLNELKVLVNGLVILEKRGFRNENKFNENEQNSRIKSQNNNHPSNQNNNNQNKDCNENYNDEEAQRFSFFNYDPLFYNSIQNSHLFKNVTTYMDEAWEIYNEYTTELSSLMNRYGYTSEEELFLGYVQENDILTFEENRNTQKSINERVKAFIRKYREKFLKNSHGENLLTKMMAWYKVSHSSCGNGSSFPWILDIFQKHAIKEVPDKTDSLENEWEKAFKRRNIRYEEFIFNPNVIFVDENARSILGDVDEHNVKSNEKSDEFNHENKIGNNSQNRKTVVQYKFRTGNKIQNALIFVFGDFSANVQLRKAKDQKVLIELFHLLFSIQFYKIDELEDAIVFILKIMNETNDYPKILIRNYISQRLFSLSKASVGQCYSEDERNKLITIASLIFIDIPLLSKMKILRQQLKEDGHNEWMAARERNFNSDKPEEEQCIYSSNKIHQSPFHGISIRGQFDPNDEVYFTLVPGSRDNERKVYYLNLLNEGTADVDFYKDDLRKFLLGHIWHHKENQSVVLIRIIPGQLLFYSLISKFAYNNLKINELSKYMYAARNKNVIKKEFMNVFFKNECFLKDEIERRFENIGIKDFARNNFELLESAEYELALQKGNKRYGIYFRGPRICGDDKNSVRDKNERNPVRNRKNRNSVRGKDDKNLKKNGDGSDEEMTEKENNFNISKTGIKPFLVSPMEVEKITKRRFVCGRYEIVDTKNRNDFMIETLFEDIIYHASRNYSNLENHERFMIVNKMLKFENGEFVVDTGDFDFLRFEINVRLQQIGSFTAYKQFIFKMKDKRLAVDKTHIRVYNERMYFLEDINGHLEFERCFEKVWLSYLEGMETFSRKKEIE